MLLVIDGQAPDIVVALPQERPDILRAVPVVGQRAGVDAHEQMRTQTPEQRLATCQHLQLGAFHVALDQYLSTICDVGTNIIKSVMGNELGIWIA
jgi:hypothetical protein